jgi:hypothetical protein
MGMDQVEESSRQVPQLSREAFFLRYYSHLVRIWFLIFITISEMDHPNIVHYVGICLEPLSLVMEYVNSSIHSSNS